MSPNKIRKRLQELEGHVDPEVYAAALFYVHHDTEHFEDCRHGVPRHHD